MAEKEKLSIVVFSSDLDRAFSGVYSGNYCRQHGDGGGGEIRVYMKEAHE